jgi:endonuclease III
MKQPLAKHRNDGDRVQVGGEIRHSCSLGNVKISRMVNILENTYGNPKHGNKTDPLSELIYIILSTRTQELSFQRTFLRLKRAFRSWNEIDFRDRAKIQAILRSNGLARLKTEQILSIIDLLRHEFGRATLSPLRRMSDRAAEAFMTQLPGVSLKVAKCVLMYSIGRQVLPVDVHVHRIARRLGFQVKNRPDTSQQLIESAIPPRLRYSFHVNAVAHGRKLCTSRNPQCSHCPIFRYCCFFKAHSCESL